MCFAVAFVDSSAITAYCGAIVPGPCQSLPVYGVRTDPSTTILLSPAAPLTPSLAPVLKSVSGAQVSSFGRASYSTKTLSTTHQFGSLLHSTACTAAPLHRCTLAHSTRHTTHSTQQRPMALGSQEQDRIADPAASLSFSSRPSLPLVLLAAFALYLAGLSLYRLFVHPLAKFPGPRLAAITSWYEAYYEIVLTGQYSRKISQLHDIYGPIIRVTPNELHIRDSRFFEELYSKNLHLDKEGWDKRFGSEHSVLTTVNAAFHKRRRAALNPMFSRRSILDFIHIIYRHIDTFGIRMQEFEGRKEPMNLSHAFPALTGDIIMDYFFGFNYGQLKHPEFESFHDAFTKIGASGHIATQFPSFFPIMNSIPDFITEWLQPAAKPLLKFKRDQWELIGRTLRGEDIKSNDARKTIFQEILTSRLPEEDKSHQRLADEAQIVVGGGVETTAFALLIASFHIINNPRIYERLHADLVQAFPNRASLELYPLEQMPYLKACIMEAVRLGYGLSARNPRTHTKPLRFREWVIPANTCVAMSIPEVSHDEEIFPNSHEFIPERWLDDPKTKDGIPLDRFMVSFGRGTRSCLGINLAWTELYLTLGMMFRRYKFELFEADVTDVQLAHDFFIPVTKLDSKGVRVFVTSTTD